MTAPLHGIRVLELAGVLAGPSVGMFLAELGAEVIKVEPPGGDVTRSWKVRGEDKHSSLSAYYTSINWGKRICTADWRRPGDMTSLHRLLANADILLTSFKPGDDQKFGLSWDDLKDRYPTLICGSIIAYAEDDPRAGYDAIIQAESGFMYMNGEAGGSPVKLPVALMDVLAGHQLKEGLLAALLVRMRTGKGAFIRVPLFGAALSALVNQAANYLVAGNIPQRIGSEHPNIVPYGSVFSTADLKKVVFAIGTDGQWRNLCEVLGDGSFALTPNTATNPERVRNRESINRWLQERIGKFPADQLLGACHSRAIPAGQVRNLEEVFADPLSIRYLHQSGVLRGVRAVAWDSDAVITLPVPSPVPLESAPGIGEMAW